MTAVTVARARPARPPLRTRPAFVAEVVAGLAWGAMLALHSGPPHEVAAGSFHAMLHGTPAAVARDADSAFGAVAAGMPGWMLMAAAMMVPAVWPVAWRVGTGSLRRRRHRAVAELLAAYLLVWAAVGAVTLAVLSVAVPPLALVLAVAAAWQLTPWHRACAVACHRATPLPPTGRAAVRGTTRYGLRLGLACAGSCWALMAVMAVATTGHLAWTLALGGAVVAQRVLVRPRRTARLVGAGLGVAALVGGLVAAFV
jgi:predicted metal-binding membrane protein